MSHRGHVEVFEGRIVPGFESAARAAHILRAIEIEELGPVIEPPAHDLDTALQIHSQRYIDFLAGTWDCWSEAGRSGTALPCSWCTHDLRRDIYPLSLDGRLAFHTTDMCNGFVEGTWEAVKASYDTAIAAADFIAAEGVSCFALCRPPGHHAGRETAAGYCYINNAAAAAQRLRNKGARRVAILDIDYHHGNGTQQVFYARSDVLVVSIHADPHGEYPFFLGHADERGIADGEDYNANFPMPLGTKWEHWREALEQACSRVSSFCPDVLIVSLGVDTFVDDPISKFRLQIEHFPMIGLRLSQMGLPTLFVMEGGYAVEMIGINTVGVLRGFERR